MNENPKVYRNRREMERVPSPLIQALIGAFSTYSTIPMPQADFTPAGLRHVLNAFPLVGAVIATLLAVWMKLGAVLQLSPLLNAAIFLALNLFLTGAIHLDGFADSMDAIFSRRKAEEQLRIMKDPHIGPMAVIALVTALILECALITEMIALTLLRGKMLNTALSLIVLWALGRALSGRMVLDLPKARKDGMAQTMSAESGDREIKVQNWLIVVLLILLLPLQTWMAPVFILFALGLYFIFRFVYLFTYDGITGDLAGLYYCVEEILFLLLLVLSLHWR